MARLALSLVVVICTALVVNAQNTTTDTNSTTADTNITLPANSSLGDPEFSKLRRLIGFAVASDLLTRDTPYTLFAPNDAAFDASAVELSNAATITGTDSFEVILNAIKSASDDTGEATARQILDYHLVTDGKFTLDQLNAQRNFLTAQGNYLAVSESRVIDSSFTSSNPEIGAVVAENENTIVYRIGSVLFPFAIINTGTKSGAVAGDTTNGTTTSSGGGVAAPVGQPPPRPAGNGTQTDGGTNPPPEGGSVCFPADATVLNADGLEVRMEELNSGDAVLVDERYTASKVFAFTHRTFSGYYPFVRIEADGDVAIEISAAHYVYVNDVRQRADAVKVGDVLRIVGRKPAPVSNVGVVMRRGLFAPHTHHGDIVVNNVVCSTYTALFPNDVAHAVLSAVRALSKLGVKEPLGNLFYNGPLNLSSFRWLRYYSTKWLALISRYNSV